MKKTVRNACSNGVLDLICDRGSHSLRRGYNLSTSSADNPVLIYSSNSSDCSAVTLDAICKKILRLVFGKRKSCRVRKNFFLMFM